MHTILSPIGTAIEIPEVTSENETTFGLEELASARDYYFENGYVVVRAAIEPAACDSLRSAFDQTVKRYPPDGHFKFLHLWPPQNPPLDSIVMA